MKSTVCACEFERLVGSRKECFSLFFVAMPSLEVSVEQSRLLWGCLADKYSWEFYAVFTWEWSIATCNGGVFDEWRTLLLYCSWKNVNFNLVEDVRCWESYRSLPVGSHVVFGVVFWFNRWSICKIGHFSSDGLLHVEDNFNDLHHCGIYRNLPVIFFAQPWSTQPEPDVWCVGVVCCFFPCWFCWTANVILAGEIKVCCYPAWFIANYFW